MRLAFARAAASVGVTVVADEQCRGHHVECMPKKVNKAKAAAGRKGGSVANQERGADIKLVLNDPADQAYDLVSTKAM